MEQLQMSETLFAKLKFSNGFIGFLLLLHVKGKFYPLPESFGGSFFCSSAELEVGALYCPESTDQEI